MQIQMSKVVICFFLGVLFAECSSATSEGNPSEPETTFWLVKAAGEPQLKLTENNIQELINVNTQKFVILNHGWRGSKNDEWYTKLTTAFLTRFSSCNVIQVDWSEGASGDSDQAIGNTSIAGRNVGNFIKVLNKNGISTDKLLVVGHSLGAHVAGFAGKTTGSSNQIPRIIALDPASPFEGMECKLRLCKEDAKFLAVIHTDAGGAGFTTAIGHADFYPNNGLNQPGCNLVPQLLHWCNHARSWRYFIEAVEYPSHFTSTKCINYETYLLHPELCGNITTHLGDLESTEEGVFYLKTNSVPPYSLSAA